jgi:hypothetical protein
VGLFSYKTDERANTLLFYQILTISPVPYRLLNRQKVAFILKNFYELLSQIDLKKETKQLHHAP